MPPKRKQGRDLPPNLYAYIDKRDGVLRFKYRDPRSGRYHGMGTDKASAIADAKALNAIIAQDMARARVASITKPVADTPKFSAVVLRHLELAEVMSKRGKIKPQTVINKGRLAKPLLEAFGSKPIGEVTVLDVAGVINALVDRDCERQALLVRSEAIQIWKTARAEGWVRDNVAEATRTVRPDVKRERLSLEQFKAIYAHASGWLKRAMELAIVTAQRRGDIVAMEFKPREGATAWVADGSLWVIQGKGRTHDKRRVCIPLSLRLDALGWTLGDIVKSCRTHTIARTLIHYTKPTGKTKPGDPVSGHTFALEFAKAREAAGITGDNPPTPHELRSLSLRLYKAQGVDIQALAGHKDAATSAIYQDVRGSEWVRVKAG